MRAVTKGYPVRIQVSRSVAQPASVGGGQQEFKPVGGCILAGTYAMDQQEKIRIFLITCMTKVPRKRIRRRGIFPSPVKPRGPSIAPHPAVEGRVNITKGLSMAHYTNGPHTLQAPTSET